MKDDAANSTRPVPWCPLAICEVIDSQDLWNAHPRLCETPDEAQDASRADLRIPYRIAIVTPASRHNAMPSVSKSALRRWRVSQTVR